VFVDERSAAIGDKVWLDSNANGVQDAGEAGIAGVTVKLLDSAGGVVSTSTTDASGNYLFSNLTPGDYAVQVVLPTGYFASSKDQGGNDALDSDIDPTTGKTINTTLSPARPTAAGMPACIRRLPSATACGWMPTRTACRTAVKPAWPA
jgi:hypothetical protein